MYYSRQWFQRKAFVIISYWCLKTSCKVWSFRETQGSWVFRLSHVWIFAETPVRRWPGRQNYILQTAVVKSSWIKNNFKRKFQPMFYLSDSLIGWAFNQFKSLTERPTFSRKDMSRWDTIKGIFKGSSVRLAGFGRGLVQKKNLQIWNALWKSKVKPWNFNVAFRNSAVESWTTQIECELNNKNESIILARI